MSNLSIGDLAQAFQLRAFTSDRKAALTNLSRELTTGLKSDLGAATGGDFGPLAGIERSLRAVKAYETANAEANTFLSASQLALENIQDMASQLAPGLLTAASARDATLIDATAADAQEKFKAVVARLNTQIAGRSLFAGAATDGAAVVPGDTMLASINVAITGLTDASDITAAIDTWFDAPGGDFETLGFVGSLENVGSFMVADGETVQSSVKADDESIRSTLKSFALAAVIADAAFGGDIDTKADLIGTASARLLSAESGLIAVRARIGSAQEQVENAQARNSAEANAYELAKTEIMSADPYETATMLESTYAQVETLYTISARLSQLRFTNYI